MSRKRQETLLEGVAKKIGSTLGVVVAEAHKIVRPLSGNRSGIQETQSRAHRTRRKSSRSTHPGNRKRTRTTRHAK